MDSPGTKQQPISEVIMATPQQTYLQNELQHRREHLLSATRSNAADASLRQLLSNVDNALSRLNEGTFGICEECHETIEADRLLCDPLVRFCLDHLSQAEQRALEADLTLAAKIQRGLLPPSDWAVDGWQARYHYACGTGEWGLLRLDRDRGRLFVPARRRRGQRRVCLNAHEQPACDISDARWSEAAFTKVGGTCQSLVL